MDEKVKADLEFVKEFTDKRKRKDSPFIYSILCTEIGDLGKFIIHDPKEDPGVRPMVGSEVEAYGDAVVQLLSLLRSRRIRFEDALRIGTDRLRENVARAHEKDHGHLRGIVLAKPGVTVSGRVKVFKSKAHLKLVKDPVILVASYLELDMIADVGKIKALVTEHGGLTSHAATICREHGIPCVSQVKNATNILEDGETISIEFGKEFAQIAKSST